MSSTPHRFLFAVLAVTLAHPSGALAQETPIAPTSPPATSPAAPAAPAAPISESQRTAEAFREIWAGPHKAIFESTFLRRELREEASWKPDDAISAQLEAAKADIERLIRVCDGAPADWQVRTAEEGLEARVPHWNPLGTTSRVLFADARRLLARNSEGDTAAAAARILAVVRLSRHFEREKLVGAVRWGRQLAAMGLLEAKRLAEAGKLTPEAKSSFLAAAAPLDTTDPLDIRGALMNEADIIITQTRRVCVGPTAAQTFVAKYAPKAKPEDVARSGVPNMDEATLHRQVESLALCYREVANSWDLPTAQEAIKSIEQQRLAGDFGGPATLIQAELPHHRASTYRLVNIINAAIKALGGEPKTVLPTRR